jgi:hypothetical protein
MQALTGTLDRAGRTNQAESPSIYNSNIRIPSFLQVISFFMAIILTVVFGLSAINESGKSRNQVKPSQKNQPNVESTAPKR